MKKVLVTILSLIYLAVSVEAAGALHDCVSALGCSTEQTTGEEPNLPCSNDAKACEFQIKRKIGEALVKASKSVQANIFPASLEGRLDQAPILFRRFGTQCFPAIGKPPLFILYRVFRI